MRRYELIAASFGLGAKNRATELGPKYILNSLIYNQSKIKDQINKISYVNAKDSFRNINIPIGIQVLPYVIGFNLNLVEQSFNAITYNYFPVILGGDHSIAIGSWSGIISALNAQKDFGLIWFDAHLDAHTYETSHSKAFHGMPVARLLGFGEEELVKLHNFKPKLNPKHLVYIGARSFEPEEHEFLKQLGVKIFYMSEIKKLGINQVFKEALEIVTKAKKGFGLSIDLDGFDPMDAPGTGSTVSDGIFFSDFIKHFNLISKHSNLKALEIVEFNPELDIEDKTTKLIIALLENLIL
jgi:arginase